jgi:hypothetical protein
MRNGRTPSQSIQQDSRAMSTNPKSVGAGADEAKEAAPRRPRKIDCAGNPEITDRQHIARGGTDARRFGGARENGAG